MKLGRGFTLVIGLSLCGVSGYLLYLLLKKGDEDDFESFIDAYNETIEIKVPRNLVNLLIGRNGKNLKLIENESKTKISFKDRESAIEHTCVIKGSQEACSVAENLIYNFIENQPIVICEDIYIPQPLVSRIIGRNEEKFFEVSSASGAKITILGDDKKASTRKINIKGTKEQISVAKSLIEDIVKQSQETQMKLESTLAKREPRLPPKSSGNLKQINGSPGTERISPVPGQPEVQFEVYISAMVSPSRFWLQIVGPKATELDLLVEEMTDYYSKPDNRDLHTLNSITKGDLVAAVFQYDGKWYRAEVLNVKPDNAKEDLAELYFVDYGDTDIVPCKELYELRTDFLRLHFQAIECYLARVEPAGEDWSEEAKDMFEELTHVALWHKLTAKYNGCCVREKTRARREGSPVPGVDLFDVINDQDVDIAQELVTNGYAVFKKNGDLMYNNRATSISNISNSSSS